MLFFITLALSLLLTPLAGMANRPLSRGDSPVRGLILPSALALAAACFFSVVLARRGLFIALSLLALANLPLFVSLAVYLAVRVARHNALMEEQRRNERTKKPSAAASLRFRSMLQGFSCPDSLLTPESQHEALILMESGTAPEKLVGIYNCPAEELVRIREAFVRHQKERQSDRGGVDYAVTAEQAAFFLQLMITATPKSLECGSGVLWNHKSVRRLIAKATRNDPSDRSVAAFLAQYGFSVSHETLEITKTDAARAWCSGEYRKIRLSALETGATLYWIYSYPPRIPVAFSKKALVHAAIDQNGEALFGVYKGSGGLADFLNKLTQEGPSRIYAVLCADTRDYKNLNTLHPGVTLFWLGEPAVIPES